MSDGDDAREREGSTADSLGPTHTATRGEAAAVLRELADAVDAGAVNIGTGEDALTTVVPAEFAFEVADGRDGEVAVRLSWAPGDEPAERDAATAEAEASEDEGAPAAEQPAVETATVAEAPESDAEARTDAASVVTAAAPLASQARFEVFRDRAGEWRWRLVHRNGNVIATGGEGYTQKHNAEKGLHSVMRNAPGAVVRDEE